ncbi:MAG TPA: signal recognition particle-docking protein FtsY [Kaistia sp.]|nr:signal recognition particle-docking protein FtsY [Kaistia sp.]
MSDEKKGFFRRIFGGGKETTVETPETELPEIEAEAEETFEAPASEPTSPEPPALPAIPEPLVVAEAPAPRLSWFQRLKAGLSRSSSAITDGIASVFTKRKLDAATLEEFEDLLIQADLGVATASAITEALAKGRFDKEIEGDEVKAILAEEVSRVLTPVARPLVIDGARKPHVILVVGVNGTGKTTTIGKLAAKFRAEGRSVMLAAGDTFRAAAVEQLKIWGQRTGASVIARATGADAAGLAFDALKEAQANGTDVLLIDTAGRLQNRAELMAELEKIIRVIKKHDPSAPHTVLLTLDATTGQNALSQVEIFGRTAGVTGLVMTKLDGTARGGILVAIAARFGLPIHFIGVGEGVDDLEPFEANDFARAIAGIAT